MLNDDGSETDVSATLERAIGGPLYDWDTVAMPEDNRLWLDDEVCRFALTGHEPLPDGEPWELIMRADRWLRRSLRKGRWRLRWHSMSCACQRCLERDFIAYFQEGHYGSELEVRFR